MSGLWEARPNVSRGQGNLRAARSVLFGRGRAAATKAKYATQNKDRGEIVIPGHPSSPPGSGLIITPEDGLRGHTARLEAINFFHRWANQNQGDPALLCPGGVVETGWQVWARIGQRQAHSDATQRGTTRPATQVLQRSSARNIPGTQQLIKLRGLQTSSAMIPHRP